MKNAFALNRLDAVAWPFALALFAAPCAHGGSCVDQAMDGARVAAAVSCVPATGTAVLHGPNAPAPERVDIGERMSVYSFLLPPDPQPHLPVLFATWPDVAGTASPWLARRDRRARGVHVSFLWRSV